MHRRSTIAILTGALALFFTACWSPGVNEVAITAPWDKMNLPVKDAENARVYTSTAKMLRVMHKDGKLQVANAYFAALNKAGWESTNRSAEESVSQYTFTKDDEQIELKVSKSKNTDVVLEKKWATPDDPGFTVASTDAADFVLTAEEFNKDSQGANRTKNKEKYTDKIIQISGSVYRVDKAYGGGPRVVLSAETPHSVSLSIANDSRAEAEKLKKDDRVVFKCRGGRHETGLRWCLLTEANGVSIAQ